MLIRHLKLRTPDSGGWQPSLGGNRPTYRWHLGTRHRQEHSLALRWVRAALELGSASAERGSAGGSIPRAAPARAGRGARWERSAAAEGWREGWRGEGARPEPPAPLPCAGCARGRGQGGRRGCPGVAALSRRSGCRGSDARSPGERLLPPFSPPPRSSLPPSLPFFHSRRCGRRARAAAPQRFPGSRGGSGGPAPAPPALRRQRRSRAGPGGRSGAAAAPEPARSPHGARGPRCHRAAAPGPSRCPARPKVSRRNGGKSGATEGCAGGGMLELPCRGSSGCLGSHPAGAGAGRAPPARTETHLFLPFPIGPCRQAEERR